MALECTTHELSIQSGQISVQSGRVHRVAARFCRLDEHVDDAPSVSPLLFCNFASFMLIYYVELRCTARASSLSDNSETATILCLICGEMLCSQSFCCQEDIGNKRVGSCTAHAYKCGSSVGVFLRVAECQILLLHFNSINLEDIQVRGCFVPAPYLDNYGETDQGLRFVFFMIIFSL